MLGSNLHHAYLLPGDDEADALLDSIFSELEVKKSGNPDFFAFQLETFGIDEARDLSAKAGRKAFGSRKMFVISAKRMTLEAQNALLKALEDPYPDTHFFIRVREEQMLIPTLLSRVQVLRPEGVRTHDAEEAEKFLSLAPAQRLAFAKKFAEDEKSVSAFLDSLLKLLKDKGSSLEKLEKVFAIRRFSDDRSASSRLLLEHLALCL